MEDHTEPPSKKKKTDEPETLDKSQDTQDTQHAEKTFSEDVNPAGDKFMLNADKYTNFVTAEELDKLREFQVLDEVKSDDEDSNDEGSESSDGIPEEEIEKMLEEGLPDDFKGAPKPKEKAYMTKKKVVLEEKGVNQFEVLPLDWIMVRHYSGMPVYVHRGTRVCTFAKPYFLGKGNTRRHDIPISAIPCLAYRRALEEEEKQKEIDRQIEEQIKSGKWQQAYDKSTQKKPSEQKTDATPVVDENTTVTCPYLHAKGIAHGDSKMPENHEKLKAGVKAEEDSKIHGEAKVEITADAQLENDDSKVSANVENIDENKESVSTVEMRGLNSSHKAKEEETEHTKNGTIDNEIEMLNKTVTEQESLLRGKIENEEMENKEFDKIVNSNINDDEETSQNESTKYIPENVKEEKPFANGLKSESGAEISSETTSQEANQNGETEANEINDNENNDANRETTGTSDVPLNIQPVVLPGGIVMPPPRVESVSTSWKSQHLNHDQVNDYCKKLFKFKTIEVMHFKRWSDRRKYVKTRKTLQYPPLPEGTKLITIPAAAGAGAHDNGGKAMKRDWVMNMNGRSYLSVFHEYVRRALQKQPVYKFKQLENAATPYQATVFIGGMQYGVGHGSSKRSAKSAAARASIRILIPEMRMEEPPADAAAAHEPDFSFFDNLNIEDPRITEFCAATCEPTPHAILRTCLLRNFGAGDKQIHTEIKKLEFQKVELTMKVGKHSATVVCKNKKSAKQRASQAILQMLHPHVHSWGSLLRLYGSRSVKSCKEKKLEEQQITLLQDEARHNEPNYAVLDKLKHEMRKLRERDAAVAPIGTMLLRDALPEHSGSNLNNVEL